VSLPGKKKPGIEKSAGESPTGRRGGRKLKKLKMKELK
jgi:hypothetical protein